MAIGNLNYRVEKMIVQMNVAEHPVKRQRYPLRFAYLALLSAALRGGTRNEYQINDILNTYKSHFTIKDHDYNELQHVERKDEETCFYNTLRMVGYGNHSLPSRTFNECDCSKLLLGEMLLFQLNDVNEFEPNRILRLYADYFAIPFPLVEDMKSVLVKIVSSEDVKAQLHSKDMKYFNYFNDGMKAYEMHEHTNSLHVTVIATMSSGKSTLLNALVGNRVFPSENKACTSKYLEFANRPKRSRETGIATGKQLDSRWNVTYADITRWNGDAHVERIELEGTMNAFSMLKKFNISFVDTPGTNNSRDRQHGVVTQEILQQQNSDVILYVLNATNLASDDDCLLLRQVAVNLGDQKIIFLLNRTDQLDLDADDSIEDSLTIARDHVTAHGIVSPTIIPISSYAAGLFKYLLDGKPLTKKETRDAHSLLELFRIPQYDMNRYVDSKLLKSLPTSAIRVRAHRTIQLDKESIRSKEIYEALKKTGIQLVERILLQIQSIPHNGR